MKIQLLAVGKKMPGWVDSGLQEYQKRLPKNFELVVREVPLAKRSKANSDVDKLRHTEGKALLNAVNSDDYLVALDVKGKAMSTEHMAARCQRVMESGKNLALLVGGPDGLSEQCLQKADELWSLSALTMPHTIVRIIVAEQIYRVWSVLQGHPYHRE